VRGSTPSDIVLFALVVTFAPALILLGIEVAVELITRRDAVVLHYAFLAGLGAVFGVQALKRSGVDGTAALIVGAIAIGVGIAVATWRVAIVRSFVTLLSAASLVFLASFIFNSKVEELVFPTTVKAAAANVDASTPVVYLLLDEFPVIDLMTPTSGSTPSGSRTSPGWRARRPGSATRRRSRRPRRSPCL
jgi:hypothetical protein